MPIRILNQRFSLTETWRLHASAWRAASARRGVNALRAWGAWRRRAEIVSALPPIMMVEVCSACDMRCPMCPAVLHPSGRKVGLMDVELYRALIDEVGDYVGIVTPWNFGEPLLHPRLAEMIEMAKRRGILVSLNTNALSLDREKADALIASGLDCITFSFDGATRETYEHLRGGGNLERVSENVRRFMARRRTMRSGTPLTILQFIVMRENEREIPAIRALAQTCGVDKLALKRFTYLEENGSPFRPTNSALAMPQRPVLSPCSRLWLSSTVLSDGRVTTCCGDLGFEHVMGTLDVDGGFSDIWNGPAYQRMRRQARSSMRDFAMCHTCPSHGFRPQMFVEPDAWGADAF